MATIYTSWDTTTNKEIFKTLVRKDFDSTSREAVVEYPRMYNTNTTSDLYERDMRYAGLPSGGAVAEGAEILIYKPKFGSTKDYTQAKYGLGFRVSVEMKKFNKWNLIQKWTKSLALKQKELKDTELAKLWNSPTATYTGFDGLALGHASHTCLDDSASTYDNILSAALSITSLESSKYYFETLKDDQGATFFAKPDTLYFQPTLEFTVMEILKSDGKPHEMSNTYNYWQNKFEPFMYHRLTSTTAWGVLAKNHPLYDINCFTSGEPDVDTHSAPDQTRDTIIDSLQFFTWGFGDPRMVFIGNT